MNTKMVGVFLAAFIMLSIVSIDSAVAYTTPNNENTYGSRYEQIRMMYLTWYLLYNTYYRKFDEIYNKSIELGVDNETLKEALSHKELAEENYNAIIEKYGAPLQPKIQAIPYIRRAYVHMKMAYEILEEVIEELEGT